MPNAIYYITALTRKSDYFSRARLFCPSRKKDVGTRLIASRGRGVQPRMQEMVPTPLHVTPLLCKKNLGWQAYLGASVKLSLVFPLNEYTSR